MNTLVTFELAKTLKEKGFDLEVLNFYCKNRTCDHIKKPYKYSFEVNANQERLVNEEIDNFGYGLTWSAPTIAEVVMWLYEKYDIWVYVERNNNKTFQWFFDYNGGTGDKGVIKFNSPTETYEAVIKYCLEKLI